MAQDDIMGMYDSPYLGAWSLQGKARTLEIQRIVGGEVTGLGGRKAKKPLVYFKGVKKPMCLSKTDAKTLRALYGTTKASGLIGKLVTLFPTTTQGAAGGEVDCLRIKNVRPTGQAEAAPELDDVPVDVEMREKQMEQAK